MWARSVMMGTGLAMSGLMLVPGVAASLAQGTRTAFALGLAVNRAARQQVLLAMAEAIERTEDLVAEVRIASDSSERMAMPVVLPGRAVSGGRALMPVPTPVASLHRSAHRLRLRIISPAGRAGAQALAAEIAAFPGVRSAVVRPATGSIVVETDAPSDLLADSLCENGVIRLAELWFHHPAALGTAFALNQLDALIRLRTRGARDLRAVLGMLLAAGAAMRKDRGRG